MSGIRVFKQIGKRPIRPWKQFFANGFYPEFHQRLVEFETAREELRHTGENLRTIFDALPDAIFICDTNWQVLEVNDAAMAMFRRSRENLIGRSFCHLTNWTRATNQSKDPSPPCESAMASLRKTGRLLLDWTVAASEHDHPFKVEGSLRLAGWYDREAILAVLRNTEERQHLEAMLRQSQKLEALGQFAAGMAHDTNNMLGVILGYADLLEEKLASDSEGVADLEGIRKAARRSSELIRQLLAFARKQAVQPQVIDLNALVEDTQKMLRRLVGEHIALAWRPTAGLGKIWVDPGQIDQVLANLVVNARDAIESNGAITLETSHEVVDEVFCHSHPDALLGSYACLSVTDTGHGMTSEIRAKVFDPFFTTKEPGRGTGLGLAMVYGILRQSGGFVSVYSEPGHGSTFRLYFPLHHAQEGEASAQEPHETSPMGSETILLVEDEEDLLVLERTILSNEPVA